jgi:hypothetical protein
MATIQYADLLKRDNVQKFISRIKKKGSFKEKTENGATLSCTGKVRAKYSGKDYTLNLNEEEVKAFLQGKKSSDYIEVEVKRKNAPAWIRVSAFYKDKDFGGVAGKSTGQGSERQELGLIQLLNETAARGGEYYVRSLGRNHKIKVATKNEGLSSLGQEPYIDVHIQTTKGTLLGISCKGSSAPSLAGGGLVGIKAIVPDLLDKMYNAIQRYIIDELGHTEGQIVTADTIPDMFIPIPDKYVRQILVGNEKMGGPIDYMYIGPMDVTGNVSNQGEITLNGNFYSIEDYMRKIPNFYFRIRKRDISPDGNIQITFSRTNKEGFPLVFMSPLTFRNNFRLVVTDKAASTGKILLI